VTGGDQVAVPAQHRLRAHQQPDLVQHAARESVQQGRQEGPVGGSEPDPVTLSVQLPLEDRYLVAQGQDLYVLGSVAPRQQPQHCQPVRHGEVRQSKQHSKASLPIGGHRCSQLGSSIGTHAATRPDVVIGTRSAGSAWTTSSFTASGTWSPRWGSTSPTTTSIGRTKADINCRPTPRRRRRRSPTSPQHESSG
jgi:hypothetical protein